MAYDRKRKNAPKRRGGKLSAENIDKIRLNKYIANAGICSRREADKLISAGLVSVNGKIVSELGVKILPTDKVKYNGAKLQSEKKRYVLLNKPKDFITTTDDERGRRTVMELIRGACKERIVPVGRLDRNTTGLLLFTNDGQMAKRLTHPKHTVEKMYHASLDKKLHGEDLNKIKAGLTLEDGDVQISKISHIEGSGQKEVGIELHIGRNRIVRRIFESLGYKVLRLDRVTFAGLNKKRLPRGHWRHLSTREVSFLQMK